MQKISEKDLLSLKNISPRTVNKCVSKENYEALQDAYMNMTLYKLFFDLENYCMGTNQENLGVYYRKMYRFIRRNIPWSLEREERDLNDKVKHTVGGVLKYAVEECCVKDEKELTGASLKKHLVGLGLIRILLMDVFLVFQDDGLVKKEISSPLTGTRIVTVRETDF